MKKRCFLIACELLLILNAYCGIVDTTTAKIAASNFYFTSASKSNQQRIRNLALKQVELQLIHQENVDENNKVNSEPCYYVYNANGDNGFIIISADDAVTPILGYAFEGKYDSINQPPAFIEWMKNLKKQIELIKVNKPDTITKVKSQWNKLSSMKTAQANAATTQIPPLLTSTWNQGCYYNNFCPQDVKGNCSRVWAGCVAVAMGQIMNYWKYPSTCNNISGYTDQFNYDDKGILISNSSYGNISGISPTPYNWSNMANNLTNTSSDLQINAVSQLLFHCGVSVQMNYSTTGSGAYSSDAAKALVNYFNYPNSVKFIMRNDYSTSVWKGFLTNELDHSRPMYYSGDGIGAHAFVCDGYQNSDYFHFNWGWGGSYNGYFYIDNLNPSSSNFNYHQTAIIGISSLKISKLNVEIGFEKDSSDSISIISTTPWTASCDKDWLKISYASNNGNGVLNLKADENQTTSDRTAMITVTIPEKNMTQTIDITQLSGFLNVSKSKLEIGLRQNSTANINVMSNTKWNATSDKDWLKISSTANSGNGMLIFTANENLTTTVRTAVVTLEIPINGMKQTITVTQPTLYILTPIITKKWTDVLICDNKSKQFVNYQWYKDSVAKSDSKQQFYYIPSGETGEYYVEVSDIKGNKGLSNKLIIPPSLKMNALSSSLNTIVLDKKMSIEVNLSSKEIEESRIVIYSMKGEIVKELNNLQKNMSLDFKNQGTYILQLQSNVGIIKESKKFIINH